MSVEHLLHAWDGVAPQKPLNKLCSFPFVTNNMDEFSVTLKLKAPWWNYHVRLFTYHSRNHTRVNHLTDIDSMKSSMAMYQINCFDHQKYEHNSLHWIFVVIDWFVCSVCMWLNKITRFILSVSEKSLKYLRVFVYQYSSLFEWNSESELEP